MSDQDALWNHVYAAVAAHDEPRNMSRAELNHLLARGFGESSNCDLHEEVLSPDDLRQLSRYGEFDDQPCRDVEPIIVVDMDWRRERVVIDGRRRVAKWLNEPNPTPRAAIIITRKPSIPVDDLPAS
jgi:hypothetical protein